MNFDITPIIEALVALALAVITGVLIPYIRSKTTTQQRDELAEWIRIAVAAAEQLYQGAGRGAEKKAYVLAWLADHGVKVDTAKIEALVEAAVYDISNSFVTVTEEARE